MKTHKFYIILVLLLISKLCFSQSQRRADILYKNKAYLEAAEIFKMLPKTLENLEKLGDCYYYNTDYEKAYKTYKKIYNTKTNKNLTESFYFKYYEVLKGTKNYKQADEISTLYLDDKINTPNFKALLEKIVPYNYELKNLTEDVGGSNFGVALNADKIVFASTKNIKYPNYHWNGKPYLDLYETKLSEEGEIELDSIYPISKEINKEKQHESNAVFTKDGKTMYFSRNLKKRISLDSTKISVVSIFSAQLIEGQWTNIKPVSFASDTYSTMHPTLNKKEDKLYFSSDMPGTLGEFDIFYVDLFSDGSFGQAINLGSSINSERREQFPYIAKDTTLYYSSNGKHGFGGLDIFASSFKNNKFLEALNLGETINSEKDDFSFVLIDSLNTGFISSNRAGLDNIYSFKRLEKERHYYLEGLVTDIVTGQILPNTIVVLYDKKGHKIGEEIVDKYGKYKFLIRPNQSYSIEGYQPKYIPHIEYFDTNDKGNIQFNIQLKIRAYKDAEEIVIDDGNGNTYIELENIYFDFGQWDIKPQAAKTLDVLVELLVKYPRMEIQLGAHTDSRSSELFNLELSEKRALATLEYLVENGIKRSRLRSKGYGKTRPLVPCGDNCTETEHSINRRCEFLILR